MPKYILFSFSLDYDEIPTQVGVPYRSQKELEYLLTILTSLHHKGYEERKVLDDIYKLKALGTPVDLSLYTYFVQQPYA